MFLIPLMFLTFLVADVGGTHLKMEKMKMRDSFQRIGSPSPEKIHEIVISIKQNNLESLEDTIIKRTTPGSPLFQQWLTFDEVGEIIKNEEGLQTVKDWLKFNNIEINWISKRSEYLRVSAPVSHWERLLLTTFYNWKDLAFHSISGKEKTYILSEDYHLPESLAPHITALFNVCQAPSVISHYARRLEHTTERSGATNFRVNGANTVSPSFLNEFYHISSNVGNSTQSQSVFETNNMGYSQADLSLFQTTFSLPQETAVSVGGLEGIFD